MLRPAGLLAPRPLLAAASFLSCHSFLQGALTGKPYAIAFCVAATVCNGGFMTLSSKLMRWAGRPLCAACMHEGTVWQLLAAICPDCTRGASAGGCAAMGAMVVALRLGSGEPLPLQFLPAPPPALPAPQRKAGCGAAGLLCGARQPRLPGALLLGVRGEACGGWPARGRQRLGWPAPRGWLWWMPIPAAAAAVGSRPSPMPLLPYCWATPPHHNTHTHTHTHT